MSESFCFLASVSRSCSLLVNSSSTQGVYLEEFIVSGMCDVSRSCSLLLRVHLQRVYLSYSFLFLVSVCRPYSLFVKSSFTQAVYMYDSSLFFCLVEQVMLLACEGYYVLLLHCVYGKGDSPFVASMNRSHSLLVMFTFYRVYISEWALCFLQV